MTYQAKAKYIGDVASQYDQKRASNIKWKHELEAVQTIVAQFDGAQSILDVPLGTGRFLECYERDQHTVVGLDISSDMLLQAKTKLKFNHADYSSSVHMIVGEAEKLPLGNKSIDYVVCIRLLNWVSEQILKDIIGEFSRVARKGMVIGVRLQHPMKAFDFFKFGVRAVLPTRHHIVSWFNFIIRSILRFVSTLKQMVVKLFFNKTKQGPRNIATGYTLHDKKNVLSLFSDLAMDVCQSILIDTRVSYLERKVKPYMFFLLKVKDQ
ncbi:MAG: methyltransferase domain-containing protein [Candidatus Omnitrophica bacterium]|nr:methyltransferase domain-containing protein [Candidatus Omnitrophota bacterium]